MNSFSSPFPLSPCFSSPFRSFPLFTSLGETPWLKQVTWTRFNKVFRGPSSFISTYNDAVVEGFIRHALGSYGWDQEPLGMMENGARNGNTCPPSPSRSPLFLAPIVHQISGIPKYEPTPIPRGYQLLLPIFLSRGKERSEKNGENAMKAEAKSTLLPSLIGTKHISEIQKLFPESKTLPRIQKHFP